MNRMQPSERVASATRSSHGMDRGFKRFATIAAAWLALHCAAHAQGVRIVDPLGQGNFSQIQSAVDAAQDGDCLLIGSGSYAGFSIVDKSLSLFATGDVTVQGTVTVRDLDPTAVVLLVGLEVKPTASAQMALRVLNSNGHVRLQDCEFVGSAGNAGNGVCSSQPPQDGGLGAEISKGTWVSFAACVLRGGGGGAHPTSYECKGGEGAPALRSSLAAVALYDCDLRGGDGGDSGTQAGNGGAGCHAKDFGIFASGTTFVGGAGGDTWDVFPGSPGWGGNGVLVDAAASAQLLDVVTLGGPGGKDLTTGQTAPSGGGAGGGSQNIQFLPGTARSAALVTAVSSDATAIGLDLTGEAGDGVYVLKSQVPAWTPLGAALGGVLLVRGPNLLTQTPLATLPGSGVLSTSLQVPNLVGSEFARRILMQEYSINALGVARLGSPMHLLALDRLAPPDCNANGINDYVETVEGLIADCNHNLVPDTCDLAAGTAADCNANGVLDACDIASGTSPDSNGNGIPDECEPQVIRYVDASAPPGGNGSSAFPFRTIQEGIDAVQMDGETVMVRDGVYTGVGNRNIDIVRQLVLRSENGPANCVIDCQDASRAFRLLSVSPPRIQGFTIRNGFHPFENGGAIRVIGGGPTIAQCVFEDNHARNCGAVDLTSASKATVEDCVFSGNSADSSAGALGQSGGLNLDTSGVTIRRCTFVGNSALFGGAVSLSTLKGVIKLSHCTIRDNSANVGGGVRVGLSFDGVPPPPGTVGALLDHCLIEGNTALEGGGGIDASVKADHVGFVRLVNSTVVGNVAGEGGGLRIRSGLDVEVANTLLWDNVAPLGAQLAVLQPAGSFAPHLAVSYSDVLAGPAAVHVSGGTLTWGAGNLDVDPLFADGDFRLAAGSPCNDAGNNLALLADLSDIDGDGNTTEPVPLDLDLKVSVADDPLAPDVGNGTAPFVDLGAYER